MNDPTPHDQATHDQAPRDQEARDRIGKSLDENLFIEAGAGTGKTTALVGRMVALVVDEGVAVEGIAAITFTERAAAELGDRFRRQLEDVARHDPVPVRRQRADAALTDVDLASLSTLHGFARRLLTDHPLEAGLPTGFDLLDDVSSQLAFDDRWDEIQWNLLDDDDLARTILLADALDIRLANLRHLARELDDRWDLLDALPVPSEPQLVNVDQIIKLMEQAVALDRDDLDESDTLRSRLAGIRAARGALASAVDEFDLVRLLCSDKLRKSLNVGNAGLKDVWGDDKGAIRDFAYAARDLWDDLVRTTAGNVLDRILTELVDATLRAADERRRAGSLTFHDLLVVARDLLANPNSGSEIRAALHDRYRYILLDEFQDTDPVQLELALLLTDPDAAADSRIDGFSPVPGSLFLVGDPKQSIYRFRRADISLYLLARDSLAASEVALTENFRTTVPIIDWINAVFGNLIGSSPASGTSTAGSGSGQAELIQPAYTPLTGRRPAASVGPAVTLLGRQAHGDEVDAQGLRQLEAADVADAITTAIVEKWTVEDHAGHQRPCTFRDIAVLLPTRTSLPDLEATLEAAGVPYRAESSSLLFATPQVRDLLMVLRAIDDPTDDLAIVAALRTPYLGCGDDDLAHWRVHHGGSWNHQADQPVSGSSDDVVASSLSWLGEMHRCRHHLGPSGVLERLIDDRRVLQISFGETRPRDAWRRVRLLSDRARAFTDAGGGSLRGFVDWCLAQADEKGRVAETVLPEVDDAAVRILTIHGAKGLEFPITILSGMSTATARSDRGVHLLVDPERSVEVSVRAGIETPGFQSAHEIDRRFQDAEAIRLLYVAATRARDHLIVSAHRSINIDPEKPGRPGPSRLLAQALGEVGRAARDTDLSPTTSTLPDAGAPSGRALPDRRMWLARRDDALELAGRPSTVSATAIAGHAAADLAEDRARPGEVGRHGTGVGRAVHGALELLDFDAADPTPIIREQAVAEGVIADLRIVDTLVRTGLATDAVRLAAESQHWRELYVAAPVDEDPDAPVIEGYIDLAVLENGPDGPGLIIVDYKTDAVADHADRAAKAERYRLQGAAYALAAERSTGLPVRRVVLCFLAIDGATEVEVTDLTGAMAEVRSTARELAGA
ncbi:MAG: UvrD-helicase domain-containing protein [Acidimicrobiales bacterium]|nr:UvrD-helicase domain-containing protein [Acidimicrobiales bacterium]